MQSLFNRVRGQLIICFKQEEVKDATMLLTAIIENEKMEGNLQTNISSEFFQHLNTSEEVPYVQFSFAQLGVAAQFFQVVSDLTFDKTDKREKLDEYLCALEEYLSIVPAIQ